KKKFIRSADTSVSAKATRSLESMQLGIHEATHFGHRDANANSGQALAVSAMTPRVRKRDWPEDRAGGRPCVGVDPARSTAGEDGRINTRKRQGVIASGSIATRFSSLVEHDPSGQARGISMLFPETGPHVGEQCFIAAACRQVPGMG